MIRGEPLSNRTKWTLVLSLVAAYPLVLHLLYPLLGGAAATIGFVVPVTATLCFGYWVGAAVLILNAVLSGLVLIRLAHLGMADAIPRALLSVVINAVACLAADRIKWFMVQRQAFADQLHQSQKMEALGRLAGGVAHDMNNTLNAIMGSVFALRHDLAAYGRRFEDLENIAAACDRGSQLTRNLLGFARKTNYSQQVFSLNAVAEAMKGLLRRTASKLVRLELLLAETPPLMEGDRGQIENAVMNLCINAIDAMEGKGTLTIATGRSEGRVFISVADTGPGMDDEVRKRAFEPFFTTKPPGQGTGLGLAMVYGVASAMGGTTKLESTLGQGTVISLTFPESTRTTSGAPASGTPRASEEELDVFRGRTVLIIDDEPLVLRSGVRALRTLGFEVMSASCGREGLELFQAHRGRLALTVVDLVMPELDGITTVERILEIAPGTPILLVSGYASETERLEALREQHPTVGFLPKPYHPAQLLAAARPLLEPALAAEPPSRRPRSAAGGA